MPEFIATVRDFAIIILAVLAIVQILFLLAVTVVLWKAIKPLVNSLQTSADNVRATTQMMSETAVDPIIRLAGIAAGTKAAIGVLMRRGKR